MPWTIESCNRFGGTAIDDNECADESEPVVSDSEKRVTIAYFYKEARYPPEEDWSGRDGTIADIRHRMGSLAPSIQMVRRTLHRLAGGDGGAVSAREAGRGSKGGPDDVGILRVAAHRGSKD